MTGREMCASFAILSKRYSSIRPLASFHSKICPILFELYSTGALIMLQPNAIE
jgi:hypothetical protein